VGRKCYIGDRGFSVISRYSVQSASESDTYRTVPLIYSHRGNDDVRFQLEVEIWRPTCGCRCDPVLLVQVDGVERDRSKRPLSRDCEPRGLQRVLRILQVYNSDGFILHRRNITLCSILSRRLVAWYSGRTLVFDRRTFPVLRSAYS